MHNRTRLLRSAGIAITAAGTAVAVAGPAGAAADRVRQQGPLLRYDLALVPEGATARVQAVQTSSGSTVVTLQVRGLRPSRDYGAHVHTSACGATGAAAGPHYQHVLPVAPDLPTDPAFGNPANEVWLDLTTDAEGNGSAQSLVRWQTRSGGAGSVVLHQRHTATGPGVAGTAGPRVGCLTVPF